MASRGILYAVFLLPVLFSAVFGTVVMADILQKPDRELNLWQFGESDSGGHHSESIEIVGIERQYLTSEPVNLDVKISDPAFDCGDLYITIYSNDGRAITQRGFFNQCFEQDSPTLPVNEKFSEVIDIPGTYKVVIELTDKDQQNTLVTSEMFTVK